MNDQAADARRRSARTRRQRTREALIAAARQRFAEHGWRETRVEDIAHAASVGVATAFTHFTKPSLLGYAYAPLMAPLIDCARADIAAGRDPVKALSRHVRDITRLYRAHENLTNALVVAVHEQSLKANGPPDPDDPNDVRAIVPMPAPMIELIAYGQRIKAFRPKPPAPDVGTYHTNALTILALSRPDRSADDVATMVLSQLLPGLLAAG